MESNKSKGVEELLALIAATMTTVDKNGDNTAEWQQIKRGVKWLAGVIETELDAAYAWFLTLTPDERVALDWADKDDPYFSDEELIKVYSLAHPQQSEGVEDRWKYEVAKEAVNHVHLPAGWTAEATADGKIRITPPPKAEGVGQAVEGRVQLCPKCQGQGIVSRPPWIPADIQQWSSSQTSFQCDVCAGAKVLYPQPSAQSGLKSKVLCRIESIPEIEENNLFNEQTLKSEIEKVWGKHGAHAEVYNELLDMANVIAGGWFWNELNAKERVAVLRRYVDADFNDATRLSPEHIFACWYGVKRSGGTIIVQRY